MRRLVLSGLLVALVAAPTTLALAGSSSDPTRRPDLRLVDRYPFVVQGQHFRVAERVKVVLTTREQRSLMVRASETGSFSANFGDVKIPVCTGFLVRAYGVRGSRAALRLAAPDCMPVGKPDSKPDQGTR
jgi:hypothetical protein